MSKADGEQLWEDETGKQWCLVKNTDGQILEVPTKYTWDNYGKFSSFCIGEPYMYEATEDISYIFNPTESQKEMQRILNNIVLIVLIGVIIFLIATGLMFPALCIAMAWYAFH